MKATQRPAYLVEKRNREMDSLAINSSLCCSSQLQTVAELVAQQSALVAQQLAIYDQLYNMARENNYLYDEQFVNEGIVIAVHPAYWKQYQKEGKINLPPGAVIHL
jgi:hypothetical protein